MILAFVEIDKLKSLLSNEDFEKVQKMASGEMKPQQTCVCENGGAGSVVVVQPDEGLA
jgi:hypothetical protein